MPAQQTAKVVVVQILTITPTQKLGLHASPARRRVHSAQSTAILIDDRHTPPRPRSVRIIRYSASAAGKDWNSSLITHPPVGLAEGVTELVG